jgi:hypothetical protein
MVRIPLYLVFGNLKLPNRQDTSTNFKHLKESSIFLFLMIKSSEGIFYDKSCHTSQGGGGSKKSQRSVTNNRKGPLPLQ